MSQTHLLYRLQQIDSDIQTRKRRLQEVLQAQKGDPALEAARARHAEAETALEQARNRQRELELELSSLNEKIKRSERRLYSGKVGNPKELSDLQQEIASLNRRKEALEDSILEAMLATEAAAEEQEVAAAQRAERARTWEVELASLREEQDELAQALNALIDGRQEQAGRLDSHTLSIYEATARSRGGKAVAGLKGDLCQACGVRLPASKARAVQGGEIIHCSSCGRILHRV